MRSCKRTGGDGNASAIGREGEKVEKDGKEGKQDEAEGMGAKDMAMGDIRTEEIDSPGIYPEPRFVKMTGKKRRG